MKKFKKWLKENYPEDDPSHIFSDPNDWTAAARRSTPNNLNKNAETEITGNNQTTVIMQKIQQLEARLDNLEKQIASSA